MIEHILILVSGALVGYPLLKKGYFSKIEGRRAGFLGSLVLFTLVAFWHFPGPWDAAALNPLIHASEHLSFFAAGFLIGSLVQMVSDRFKVLTLLLGFVAHSAYGWILASTFQVYPLYTLAQQGNLGLLVFAMDPLFIAGIFLFLWRKPTQSPQGGSPAPLGLVPSLEIKWPPNFWRRFRVFVPVLSISLLIIMAGFYGTSIVADTHALTQQPSASGSVVYIIETPVSWQYSPRSIRVVIGLNSTVTWISRSLSYDTITGPGNLSSGPLAPGQSFTYAFTQPGTYEYHCIYHPWMVGYIQVVESGNSR